jgi:hypothetical protein
VAMMAWAGAAGADLYRWVDQESGSVKYSSYPPPWYGDEAKQRRAPKVEVIPSGRDTAARPAPLDAETEAAKKNDVAKGLEPLEVRRRQLLAAISAIPPNFDYARDGPAFRRQIEAFQAVSMEMDKLDPKGAERRLAEAKVAIARLAAELRSQLGGLVPPAER